LPFGGFTQWKKDHGISTKVAFTWMKEARDQGLWVERLAQPSQEATKGREEKTLSHSTPRKRTRKSSREAGNPKSLPEVDARVRWVDVGRGKVVQKTEYIRKDGKKLTERQDRLLGEEAQERAERMKDWPVSNERIAEIGRKAQEEVRAEWAEERMWSEALAAVMPRVLKMRSGRQSLTKNASQDCAPNCAT
jgi:hypothetical protein